jgi:hypothetical protein
VQGEEEDLGETIDEFEEKTLSRLSVSVLYHAINSWYCSNNKFSQVVVLSNPAQYRLPQCMYPGIMHGVVERTERLAGRSFLPVDVEFECSGSSWGAKLGPNGRRATSPGHAAVSLRACLACVGKAIPSSISATLPPKPCPCP